MRDHLALGVLTALSAACTTVQSASGPRLKEHLAAPGARVMFVGAHPDDEALAAPILARACIALGRPCLLFIFTRGEGGRCPWPVACWPSLGDVRAHEIAEVARAYGAELELHRFWNVPLPRESFPPRESIAFEWRRSGDPGAVLARAVERFRPTILLTFDPDRGFTDHPEHALAARFAKEAVTRAGGRAPHTYLVLNRYWMTLLAGTADPAVPTETFDTHVSCGKPGRTCLDTALDITALHRTQKRDMGLVRWMRPQMGQLFLREVTGEWR